ncbi:endonuclease/exonuclease/phosphatase family protein [Ilumatobacter nonamiensis]|uniref:endonuclease/exonuclease/phosphatase family protein n=1 Tax=Ilumatobacter nonamiensis TaxID=467093 RepID=UPI00034A1F3E|nr:endonuclease/exonuclease/phosphatase family protein [Ilumatobacter nonamiensis]
MRRGRQIAELIGWSAVAGMGAVMLSQAAGVDGTRALSSAQALTPFGIPIVVGVAAGAVWRRSHTLAVASASVGIAALLLAAPIVFPAGQDPVRADAAGLRAASINLLYSNPSVDLLADDLLRRDPDVIVFSEYTVPHQQTLLAHALADRYPYRIDHALRGAGGMAMWSKFPLTESSQPETSRRVIEADLDGPDGPILVLGVHPPTPIHDHDAWSADLDALGDRAGDAAVPTLMIGDFNASYWNPVFRSLLDHDLVDAHIAHGRGWSPSWPTDELVPPFVRLDHALTGNGLVSTDVDDFEVPGSDHAGFVVTVKPAEN